MTNYLKPWISDTFPDFVSAEHPQFKLFLEAYYEWLEVQNDSDTANVKELFRGVRNPGAIINNIPEYRDVDETINQFIQYFQSEVLPVAVDANKVTDEFFIKKVRDLYLSKGTPASFKLLFRILYDEEIDIFETRDNILEASEGKFLSYPVASFRIVGFQERLTELDLTLATITDDSDAIVGVSLSGTVVGRTSENELVLAIQTNNTITLSDRLYIITDPANPTISIEVRPMLQLTSISVGSGGAGYRAGDQLAITSLSRGDRYIANINSVSSGKVDGIFIRDRGIGYEPGDAIVFTSNNASDGSGGGASVTEVDNQGRILAIDGVQVRTGILHNGYLSDNFEDVVVPVLNGGIWRQLPRAVVSSQTGRNAQIVAFSDSIGQIRDFNLTERGFFPNDSDVDIETPMNVTLEREIAFPIGTVVRFQALRNREGAFNADSERILIELKAQKDFRPHPRGEYIADSEFNYVHDSDLNIGDSERYFFFDSDGNGTDIPLFGRFRFGYNTEKVLLPFSFDKDGLFQWIDSEISLDSEDGLLAVKEQIQKYTNLRLIFDSEGDGFVDFDSDANISQVDSEGGIKFVIDDRFVDGLDDFHFRGLNIYLRDDSDFSFSWERLPQDIQPGLGQITGEWESLPFYGQVLSLSPNNLSMSLGPIRGFGFPSDSDLDSESRERFTILRIAQADPDNGDIFIREGLLLSNIVSNYNRASFNYTLGYSVETERTFINDDGFLNSLSGGVLQDGLFYSNFTYIIQTTNPIERWREVVKTMLHPAGLQLFAELNVNQEVTTNLEVEANTFFTGETTSFTFDAEQGHYAELDDPNVIDVSNERYEANAFKIFRSSVRGGEVLTADNYDVALARLAANETGNSWFDYEPVGLVRREYLGLDSDDSINAQQIVTGYEVTTQDSDGEGFVLNRNVFHVLFDSTRQDLYKRSDRNLAYNRNLISQVQMDEVNERFSAYDSDFDEPRDFGRWSDSDFTFKGIDYTRLRRDSDNRVYKSFLTKRKREYIIDNALDFNSAMKLADSLEFVEGDTTYTDFEAYERKWNTANTLRLDSEGWQINGYSQQLQNVLNSRDKRKKYSHNPRQNVREIQQPENRLTKAPLNYSAWYTDSEDWWVWHTHYFPELNSGEVIVTSFGENINSPYRDSDYDPHNYRDPEINRRLTRRRG